MDLNKRLRIAGVLKNSRDTIAASVRPLGVAMLNVLAINVVYMRQLFAMRFGAPCVDATGHAC